MSKHILSYFSYVILTIYLILGSSSVVEAVTIACPLGTRTLTIRNNSGRRVDIAIQYLYTNFGPCPDNNVKCYVQTDIWQQFEDGKIREKPYCIIDYDRIPPHIKNRFFKGYPRGTGFSGPAITSISWSVGGVSVGRVADRDLLFPSFVIRDGLNNYEAIPG